MKKLFSIIALVCLACVAQALLPVPACGQNLTTISGSNITDLNGARLAAGQLCFLATDQNDNPISFNIGGGGQSLRRAYCSAVTNGVVAGFTVPNPQFTAPSGIYYRVTVEDSSTGQEVLRYAQVTFAAATFNFDNYAPANLGSFAALTGNSVSGNLSVSGNIAATGTVTGSNIPGAIPGAGSCTNQFVTALNAAASPTCTTDTLASAQHANQGTTTQVLHGNGAGNPSWSGISLTADTSANQGTAATVLHGNAAGQPSFGAVGLTTDVTGTLPLGNGGTGQTTAANAFNALSPMTTLGDIEYESAANTASRLAGNTTTTKKYLSQTGSGSVSATPSWAQIAATDLSDGNTGTGSIVHAASPTITGTDSGTETLQNKTLNGAGSGNSVNLLNAQGPLTAITGTGTDATTYTYTVPANTVQAGKGLRVTIVTQHNSGAAANTYKLKLGATTLESSTLTVSVNNLQDYFVYTIFNNNGVQNAQNWVRIATFTSGSQQGTGTSKGTSAENFANALVLTHTFSVANTDQVTPLQFIVELIQ